MTITEFFIEMVGVPGSTIEDVRGSSECGLVGPFAFPHQWTWQRNLGGRKSSRKRMHFLWDVRGRPLFIEAVPVPVKQLRNLLYVLALRVQEHYELHVGEAFFALFFGAPLGSTDEAVIDFTQALDEFHCPRFGSRNLVNYWRDWFYLRFVDIQHRAIANGRYFPPPRVLRVWVSRTDGVWAEVGFSRGFLADDALFIVRLAPREWMPRAKPEAGE